MSPERKPKQNLPENRPNASMPEPKLDAILTATRDRVASLRAQARELERRAAAAPEPLPFARALAGRDVGVIAEVKRRSPSAGAIREDLDPVAHARAYTQGGAVASSVLTDELHFGGSLDDLVPVLRKYFILDELQLYEARAVGASAVLLIVRALTADGLRALRRAARDQGLGVLVEVHSAGELELALAVAPTAVGVNSRDLATFAVDLARAERLVASVPRGVPVIAESGIATRADVERMAAAGADLVLVGTSVAGHADPERAVRELVGVPRKGRARRSECGMRNAECGISRRGRSSISATVHDCVSVNSAFRTPHSALARGSELCMASEAGAHTAGRFGPYGGRYVPETLMAALEELDRVHEEAKRDPSFQTELDALLKDYVGRPTPLTETPRLGAQVGAGIVVALKRADLNHTGAHKINNTLGQALLARRMGKRR